MSDQEVRKEKCWACYSSLTYLAGYCPVCNDTGFVEVKSRNRPTRSRRPAVSRVPEKKDELMSFSDSGFFL